MRGTLEGRNLRYGPKLKRRELKYFCTETSLQKYTSNC
jgi:hypothetical protein